MKTTDDVGKRVWRHRVALGLLTLIAACHSSGPKNDGTWKLDDLTADKGMTFRLPEFVVPAGHEEQSCFFVRVPDLDHGKDFWIDHVRSATSPGTHHLNVFRVRTIVDLKPQDGEPTKIGPYDATVVYGHDDYKHSPCWGSANWADWPLVANTQSPEVDTPYTDWKLPEHVAIRFTPGELLMIQTHYVNSMLQPAPFGGKVGINMYRSADSHPQELGTLFATQQNIRICQSAPKPLYSGACHLPGAATIVAANGHFHSRGAEFTMFKWDGRTTSQPSDADRFYASERWDEPLMATGLDVSVGAGGGIWWNCAYEWREPLYGCDMVNAKDPQHQGDCCYVFGGNTDVGEHCNVFVYYYPKVSDKDVFCN
jgi:hypothetical protein